MTGATVDKVAAMFTAFSSGARGTALKKLTKGDIYGWTLANARSDVYAKAAELVRVLSVTDAVAEMMKRTAAAHVRTPPFLNFDAAGVLYVTARAWQFCARELDPALPEVAPSWD
ncbi:MAG TPA: hypothetical protein VHF06_10070 [Pseudonocardiaceae bacterium]|jgi:hypothetical protein|nr:hypothetical protein [Pseudonocardiaceae bacterium]